MQELEKDLEIIRKCLLPDEVFYNEDRLLTLTRATEAGMGAVIRYIDANPLKASEANQFFFSWLDKFKLEV